MRIKEMEGIDIAPEKTEEGGEVKHPEKTWQTPSQNTTVNFVPLNKQYKTTK